MIRYMCKKTASFSLVLKSRIVANPSHMRRWGQVREECKLVELLWPVRDRTTWTLGCQSFFSNVWCFIQWCKLERVACKREMNTYSEVLLTFTFLHLWNASLLYLLFCICPICCQHKRFHWIPKKIKYSWQVYNWRLKLI